MAELEWELAAKIAAITIDLWLLITLFCILFILRQRCVFDARREIRKLIAGAIRLDIYSDREWRWRWADYHRISYSKMMWIWWRPPESFWQNWEFMRFRELYESLENHT
jgi:hypothetical protein